MKGFLASAMKAIRTPGLVDKLGQFHRALILHLIFMDAKHADGNLTEDFDIAFRQSAREYIDFLKSMGVEIENADLLPTMTVTFDKDCDFSKALKP